jgi:hypothetical protein
MMISHVDVRQRLADRVQVHVVIALRGGERGALGLAVDLHQIYAKRTEEQERVLADRFTARVGVPDARHAEVILDRTEHERFARQHQRLLGGGRCFALQAPAFDLDGARHEEIEQALLAGRRVLDADLHARQHCVPRAGRGEVPRRRHFAKVAQHRFLPLRDVHREAHQGGGTDREDEVTDPRRREIRVVFLPWAEETASCRVRDAGENIAMAQRDALRRASGSR